MADHIPVVQFYEGIPEEISNISLRRDRNTGVRRVVLFFERMEAIEQFKSFRNRFSKALKLIDEEGVISIEPLGIRFIFGGPEGDHLKQVECTLEIDQDDHWERLMRFLQRYAEANGMAYGESEKGQ
ncbi:photosystem II reaction center protein Psb28 [Pseudanabaena sp. FACHB-2040]|uniref:photosystem II reaction center protein Psb28 n=1 Tax=Pseudanabaena sp. FACHB-2040 TaxID=2692859 RepID=UPI001685DDCC|nr:photosystem II reaction center protein Psb28 [Pseudanabaena sp. FACHB-2040]